MPSAAQRNSTTIAQLADEASFLWQQRSAAVHAARYSLPTLASLDERLAAQLDGLRIVAGASWNGSDASLVDADPGAAFAPMLLALEARNARQVDALLSMAEGAPPLRTALCSAFGWVSARFLQGVVHTLLLATSPFRRQVGLACCAMHGVDPGTTLEKAATAPDADLRATAISAIGTLGKSNLLQVCELSLGDPNEMCRFAAARSLVLLGDRGVALQALARMSAEVGNDGAKPFRLMLQAMNLTDAHGALQRLSAIPLEVRRLIQGTGIVGDPVYVPWLIEQMTDVASSRLAGEAFSLISGVDLGRGGVEGEKPEGLDGGPNDDPDDGNVDMDPDDGLLWPNRDRVADWWAHSSSRFHKGTRYFMGAPVTIEHSADVLRIGSQRQRILAAHYLCLLEPATALFNTSAPARRQQRLLASMP